jgi:phage-related protein
MAKDLDWLGDAKEAVSGFPEAVRQDVGHQLWLVQEGHPPTDWKPMSNVGAGVMELRLHHDNEYRVMYVAKFVEAVYVIHAFEKKTQRTSQKDLKLAEQRYRQLIASRT